MLAAGARISDVFKRRHFSRQFRTIENSARCMIEATPRYEGGQAPGHIWTSPNYWMEKLFEHGAEWTKAHFRTHVGDALSDGYSGDYSEFSKLTSEQMSEQRVAKDNDKYSAGLPPSLILSEPHFDLERQWGVNCNGRQTSYAINRMQRVVANLYRFGVLSALHERTPTVLEIGSGYGLLAHNLLGCLPLGTKYILIDLPPVLALAATGLTIWRAELRASFLINNFDLGRALAASDIVFVPHYAVAHLTNVPPINLTVNTASFQEMTEESLMAYAAFLGRQLDGWLYSENMRRHPHNYALMNKVATIFGRDLALFPEDSIYDDLERNALTLWQHYVHFGTARARPAFTTPPKGGGFLWGENYRVELDPLAVKFPA